MEEESLEEETLEGGSMEGGSQLVELRWLTIVCAASRGWLDIGVR